MRKLHLFSILIVLGLVSVGFMGLKANATTYITGYDTNNGCVKVQVERGTYVPGISLYPNCNLGITTGDTLSYGGVNNRWITGSCANATTTILSVRNPWGATAYVDQVLVFITNGTSTFTMDVGTSSTAYAAPSEAFVDDTGAATSTVVNFKNMSGSASAVYGFTDPGTNSQDIAVWKSGEYINGLVTTLYAGAFTEETNSFSCTYKIHSFK